MNITFKFKSTITTEQTYPHSYQVEFVREQQINDYENEDELREIIFKDAHSFEDLITHNQKVVSITTEILGITFIHDAHTWQLLDLARLGIERI